VSHGETCTEDISVLMTFGIEEVAVLKSRLDLAAQTFCDVTSFDSAVQILQEMDDQACRAEAACSRTDVLLPGYVDTRVYMRT
jgi:hypothetical protein